jgi:phage I-like protein
VDLEHQSSLSGAAGWISKVEVRGGDGAFATIDLNDRGQELVAKDAYRYFSPEYYDKWVDPATNKEFTNLLIGGALTNRPFFKGMQPVAVMSEGALAFAEPATEEVEAEEKQAAAPTQRDDGVDYPAAAFLYVPDPEKPSTWKVRIWDSTMKVTRAQLGAAAAAFSPGGFRGNPVQMPAADRAKCIARLRSLYSQLGVKPEEMPAQVKGSLADAGLGEADASAVLAEIGLAESASGSQDMGMTEEEAKRLTELETAQKTLTERLAAEETARKAAEAQATAASEKAAKLERDANRRTLTEEVRSHRLGYRGEVDAAVDRLEAMQAKLSVEEFQGIIEDAREVHARFAESDLLKQTSRPGPLGGVQNELGTAVAKLMSERNLSEPDAIVQAVRDNPRLYAQMDAQHNRRAKMGGD